MSARDRIAAGVGVTIVMACAPGPEPASSSSGSTSTASTGTATAATSSSGPVGASSSTDAADTSTTAAPEPSTSSTTSPPGTSSTTDEPPPADCVTLGCPDPDQWCVRHAFVEDTDGSDSATGECHPFPARCEGLMDTELLACLQPLCCLGDGCPVSVDVEGMQINCVADPGMMCGFCGL